MPALRISIEGSADAGAVFGPQGGTLGRAEQNTLVLHDAERSVARLGARVEWRTGGFVFINMGLSAAIHNGAVLGTADEAGLAAGDVLRIGRFSLLVSDAGEHELPLEHTPALFDDMTGAPLPPQPSQPLPRAPAWSDIALFDDSTAGALEEAAPAGSVPALVAALLHGMGCAAPALPAEATAEQAGEWMRSAVEDTLRTWLPHCSPAVQQAWFLNFEQALDRVAQAQAQVQTQKHIGARGD